MTIPIYQVDAFTRKVFRGNYAAVCLLKTWPDDTRLLQIAQENNISETAFIIQDKEVFHIRWFTPEIEMDLCGHATLAGAHVIFNHLNYIGKEIIFHSKSGVLKIYRDKEGKIHMNFPSRPPVKCELPEYIERGLEITPKEVYKSRDYILVYDDEQEVKNAKPDQKIWDTVNIDPGGIVLTAPAKKTDFVSRFFTPQATIFEDPVTGSAHCSLVPFWAARLKKTKLQAKQISKRCGVLDCSLLDDRVSIGGYGVTYLKGEIYI